MPSVSTLYRFALAAFLLAMLPTAVRSEADQPQLQQEYRRLSEAFSRACPDWRPAKPQTGSLLFVAPDEYSPAAEGGSRYMEQRKTYAAKLFDLARSAADAGQLSWAFQWATESLREDPDHEQARRVLGYIQRDGQWLTPYGARMADSGKTWHSQFGWIPAEYVDRYEAGERLVGTRWISAHDDAERHREMKKGWQVRTDHFLVTTNHSLEAAAELAAKLEALHQIWRQLFAGFYLKENEVQRLFAGQRPPRSQVRPFRVYYHRDRDQYANTLRRLQPRIADTLGIYFDTTKEAHFFAGEDQDAGTLYHEAVHQLFQETKPGAKRVGSLLNFWVIEGVATYFETLREHNDPGAGLYFTIGSWEAGRLPAARARLMEGYYVPLTELTRIGQADIQRRADLRKLYNQFAGLAAFLIDGNDGSYREAFVQYLDAVYSGSDTDRTLAETAGQSYSELDQGYREHAQSLP